MVVQPAAAEVEEDVEEVVPARPAHVSTRSNLTSWPSMSVMHRMFVPVTSSILLSL